MIRLIALAATTAVLANAASAGSLDVQRRAVEAKLRAGGSAPAVPTGIEVPGKGAIYIERGKVIAYDCKDTRDFLTREPCWQLGGGLSPDSSAAPGPK